MMITYTDKGRFWFDPDFCRHMAEVQKDMQTNFGAPEKPKKKAEKR